MEDGDQVLRLGIMCDSEEFLLWQKECLENLFSLSFVKPILMIINDNSDFKKTSFWIRIKGLKWPIIFWSIYEKVFVKKISKAFEKVGKLAELEKTEKVNCKIRQEGRYSQYLDAESIKKIDEHNLDFILKFGFGIIRGEILKVPKYGIWSFHHGDAEKYRGLPPGFWEIYNNEPFTGVMLQRLTEKLDSGIVLKKGKFETKNRSFLKNLDNIIMQTVSWPAEVCKDINRRGSLHINN
ncbi:MAG: hypothetical protein KKF78_01780, partial [Candidatus Omnitrophica bacterium]|nr:hypothetical protein [Candidatus Omnitrophota bacterium]